METLNEPNNGQDVLAAFVPRLALELGRGGIPSWTSIEGSMLSADISGFTALSEKLAGKGRAGAEEITSLINTCFTALIDTAYAYGGEVIKFGGDALLILFRGARHERRAADAGLLMQLALRTSPTAKRAHLTMSVGIAAGPFDVFLVGSGYRELLITGPRASEVIRLEGEAAIGDTLVDPVIAAQIPADMKVREERGGWVITGSTKDAPCGTRDWHLLSDDRSPYVPRSVVEQLAAFSGTGGEHRLVSVGFLMVIGVGALLERHGPSIVAEAFHRLVDEVEEVGAMFGVTNLHTDIAPDGVKFLRCAGAPVSHGHISDALLHSAIRLARAESPFVLRQGVQTGRVFAGFLGSERRRTYTLMGDPVNTAARLLGEAADRDVVAVASVVRDTRTVFVTEELEPFLVKGKTEPIIAHTVHAATDEVRHDTSGTTLVGRQRELGMLTHAISELGEVVILSGGAGVGKSRLLDAAWTATDGLRVFQGACTPYGAASPYSVFRPLLRVGAGIDLNADPFSAGASLLEIVTQTATHLLPMLPLLAVPFGADVAPTPDADAVDPLFRRARIHDLVVDYLDTVLDGPVFLVVEDLHWIDEASGQLLNHLIIESASRPWAGVLTRRPSGTWTPPKGARHVHRLDIEPLTDEDIRSIAIQVSVRPLSDAELSLVASRSGGNPLFTIELTRALGRGTVDQLPESIEGLISTRIDALPGQQRHLLRVASVFGREFDLLRISAVGDDDLTVTAGLDELIEHDRDSTFRFRHAMYRDVAYEGLPFRERRRLHERTGRLLESELDDPTQIASLLSLHFAAAGRHSDAYRYATRAAADATSAYAHAEAIEQYERALRAGRHCPDVDAAARAALHDQLGRAKGFNGDLVGAEAAWRRVGQLTDDVDMAVNSLRRRALVRQKQGRLTVAIRLLRRADRRLAGLEPESWVHRLHAEIHLGLAGVRMDQGQLDDACREGELAQFHAEAADDRELTVLAYGAIVGALTDWCDAEPYVQLGLGTDTPVDAYEARSILANNLGMVAFFAGRWSNAVDLYEQGRSNAQAMGNVTGAALSSMNAAEVLIDQGHLEQAGEALAEIRRVLGAAGYAAALSYAELLTGVISLRCGEVDAARSFLDLCRAKFRNASMHLYALESLLRLAEVHLIDGTPDIAELLARQALEESSTVARSAVIEARAERLLGLVSATRADVDSARSHFDLAIRTCRSDELPFELALTLAAQAGITGEPDGRPALEAARIFEDLGVVEAGRPNPHRYWLPGLSPLPPG